jgi:hypothetical protein
MTKPFTHVMPYLVGMLVGWWCSNGRNPPREPAHDTKVTPPASSRPPPPPSSRFDSGGLFSASGIFGSLALAVALVELFLPYKWNNSHLPSPLMASVYAALFRLGWSLVLAYVVLSCRHNRGPSCERNHQANDECQTTTTTTTKHGLRTGKTAHHHHHHGLISGDESERAAYCYCGSGGNYLNRLLSLRVFVHLSKLSFVAYLIHLPLMSVFIGQTRGLFAFSHTLVIHFAISYLVISFALSFLLVHFIEFPFITFERLLFNYLFRFIQDRNDLKQQAQQKPLPNTVEAIKAYEKHLFYQDPRIRPMMAWEQHANHLQYRLHEPPPPASPPTLTTATTTNINNTDGRHLDVAAANQLHRTTTGGHGHSYHLNQTTIERL